MDVGARTRSSVSDGDDLDLVFAQNIISAVYYLEGWSDSGSSHEFAGAGILHQERVGCGAIRRHGNQIQGSRCDDQDRDGEKRSGFCDGKAVEKEEYCGADKQCLRVANCRSAQRVWKVRPHGREHISPQTHVKTLHPEFSSHNPSWRLVRLAPSQGPMVLDNPPIEVHHCQPV